MDWANERKFDDGLPARMWQVYNLEVFCQTAEWVWIAKNFPDVPVVVTGDLNQDRDRSA